MTQNTSVPSATAPTRALLRSRTNPAEPRKTSDTAGTTPGTPNAPEEAAKSTKGSARKAAVPPATAHLLLAEAPASALHTDVTLPEMMLPPRFLPVFLGAFGLGAGAFASVSAACSAAGFPEAPLGLGLIVVPVLAAVTAEAARSGQFRPGELRRATLLNVIATMQFTFGASMSDLAVQRPAAWLLTALLMVGGLDATLRGLRRAT